jgi:hypothetical protein
VSATLREKLATAGFRLRALAKHMPTEWQQDIALSWADEALRASAIEAFGQDAKRLDAEHESAVPQGDAR